MTIGGFGLRGRVRRIRDMVFVCSFVLTAATGLSGNALAAGAYVVDDSDTADPGVCRVESWASFSERSDFVGATNPICGIPFLRPAEIGVQFGRTGLEDEWGTSAAPKLKVNLAPSGVGTLGVGIAGGFTYDFAAKEATTASAYIPVTYMPDENIRINANLGWLYDKPSDLNWLTWGASAEFKVSEGVTLIGEVFGQTGQSVRPRSTQQPRIQTGIRFTPMESFDVDVIYGLNVSGENRNWITLGLNVRF